jgi:hypothetical protein
LDRAGLVLVGFELLGPTAYDGILLVDVEDGCCRPCGDERFRSTSGRKSLPEEARMKTCLNGYGS